MLTRITPPTTIVSLADAKSQLRMVSGYEDTLIERLIETATEYLDGPAGILGQFLGQQQWTYKAAAFDSPMRLPMGPIITIDTIQYLDSAGATQTVPGADYYHHADTSGPYIKLVSTASWPDVADRDDAVTITFTAGMASIPQPLISAILLIVSHLNENREVQVSTQTFPTGFDLWDMIAPHRRVF